MIKVLLVEDNPGDVRLVQELLSADSPGTTFSLKHVPRLADAVHQLYRADFDVVLLDLSLPDVTGVSTVRHLQASATRVPIIVLTGMSDEETAHQAMRSGAQDYLVKGEGDGNLVWRAIRYAIERKRAEQQLIYLAQFDPLTGLANRSLFRDRLEHAVARAHRNTETMALLYLDLDRFKGVNDTLGHELGDRLLRLVAERVQECVRESDTVARLGGDEFTVILEGLEGPQGAASVARKILDALRRPLRIDQHELYSTASIGIAVYPETARDAETLIRNADTAMYNAKAHGRNAFRFYTTEMGEQVLEELAMETSLRRALERGEFELYYQPRIDISTRHIIGVEALLRWNSADLGWVRPGSFIPLAEETGLIIPIGEWVLRTACARNRAWQDAGYPHVCMAVNISASQFRHSDFPRHVSEALESSGLQPQHLELEITESILMEDTRRVRSVLAELKAMGIGISVDDFGTGYSSLSYLKRFPLDALKIDQSFVQDITRDQEDAAITRAIIALGHSLRLKVVAEGVESPDQLAFLRNRWCDGAQGNLFSPPVPADAISRMLERGSLPLVEGDAEPEAGSGGACG